MRETRPTQRASVTPRGPVDDLVAEVLDGDPDALQQRLEAACAAHPGQASVLRRRVEVLVEAGFMDPVQVELPDQLGEFRLLDPIGQGGMGIVYRARQESLERDVAVKLIRPEELRFAGARERFAREVTTIARLSHPGIVPVYAVGDEGGVPYFAMELVRGETLAHLLSSIPKLRGRSGTGADLDRALAEALGEEPAAEPAALFQGTWEETSLRIVRAVADALEHAHTTNILHRDLKPSNVMLTRDGRVMLLDFGLSSVEGSERMTRTGVQVGSFAYMAPELLTDAGSADRRSDVYALGVTLYELLAGRLPYRARSLAALRTQVLQARPRSLRRDADQHGRVSWEAETVCLVAMEVDRSRRYASAGELARDLDNVLSSRPIAARRPGLPLRLRRFAGRHPAWSAGVALLALTVPTTWAVQERVARVRLASAKAQTDRANVALAESLEEVRRQEARADANFGLARGAVDRMLDRLGDVRMRDMPHLETLRRDVLQDALAFHEALVQAEPENAEQRLEYAKSLRRVAEIHGLLSEFDEVSEMLGRATKTLEQLIAQGGDERHYEELGQVTWRLVESENYRGQLSEAIRIGQRGVDLFLARGIETPAQRLRLARIEYQLGHALQRADRVQEGQETLLRSVDSLRELRVQGQLSGDGPGLLATALAALGEPQVYVVPGDRDEETLATEAGYLLEALEIRRSFVEKAAAPDNRFAVMEGLNSLAGNYFARGMTAEAIETYLEAREIVDELARDFPSVTAYLDAQAATYLNLGSQYLVLEDHERGEEAFTRAAEAYSALHRARPQQRGLGVRRLIAMQSLVDARLNQGDRSEELLARIDEAEQLGAQLARSETGQGAAMVARLVPRLALMRGKVLVDSERIDEALASARALADGAGSRAEPLFQAAVIVTLCAGAEEAHADLRAECTFEAIDCVARGLDQEPTAAVLETYLGGRLLDPLRAQPAFVELLESRGLERWLAP